MHINFKRYVYAPEKYIGNIILRLTYNICDSGIYEFYMQTWVNILLLLFII